MRRIWGLMFVALAACGRIGFDNASDGDANGDGNAANALHFDYPQHNVEALLGSTQVSMAPIVTGPPVMTFTVSPALPAGLSINAQTGVISGIGTTMADNTAVAVTGAGAGGASATVRLNVTVLPGYLVDVTADGNDDDGGTDNVCHSTIANGCTLRAAVQTANRHTGKQLIRLPAGTYTVSAILETLMNSIEIAGDGASLTRIHPPSVHPGYGLFAVGGPQTLAVKDLAADEFGVVDGAVITVNTGAFLADHASFANNAGAGRGGVVFATNAATVDMTNCTFTSNSSIPGNGWGGVVNGEGNGVQIHVGNSFATNNTAGWGSFSHITTGAHLILDNSTLVANISTVSGTLATPGGTYDLTNDTIVNNTNTNPDPDNAIAMASAGIYIFSSPASYVVVNTIVAGNTDFQGNERNCNNRDPGATMFTSHGGNVFSDDGRNCATWFKAPEDRFMSDPGLDVTHVGLHGGPTFTVPLLPGSIALDTAIAASCPATDQRGVPRGNPCDVGAFESP